MFHAQPRGGGCVGIYWGRRKSVLPSCLDSSRVFLGTSDFLMLCCLSQNAVWDRGICLKPCECKESIYSRTPHCTIRRWIIPGIWCSPALSIHCHNEVALGSMLSTMRDAHIQALVTELAVHIQCVLQQWQLSTCTRVSAAAWM